MAGNNSLPPGVVLSADVTSVSDDPGLRKAYRANFDAVDVHLNATDALTIQADRQKIADANADRQSWWSDNSDAANLATIAAATGEIARLTKEDATRNKKLNDDLHDLLGSVPAGEKAAFVAGFLKFHGLISHTGRDGSVTFTPDPHNQRETRPLDYVPRCLDPRTQGI